MSQLRIYRIMAEFSDGAVINEGVSAKDHDEARRRLDDLIKRALSINGQQLVEGSELVQLESVVTSTLIEPPE